MSGDNFCRRTHAVATIPRLTVAAIVGLVLVALVCAPAGNASARAPTATAGLLDAPTAPVEPSLQRRAVAAKRTPVTPIIASLVPQRDIVAVRGSDGRFHVLYELLLTNVGPGPETLESVEVVDATGGRTVQTITAAEMVASEALRGTDRAPSPDTTFAANESRVLYVSLGFKSRRNIPGGVEHRFTVSGVNPFSGLQAAFRYRAASIGLSARRPPVLSPPLAGKGWVASDGCCAAGGGHAAAMHGLNGKLQGAERYAVDWIQVDASGRIFTGDPEVLSNWPGYGARVIAMSDGVVTKTRDDLPDQVPLAKPPELTFGQLPGNHVVIEESGVRLSDVYAHMKPGSVRVEKGDRVRAGDVLGRLGNSGGSLAPHLHFHVVNGPSAGRSDGYPYTIDSFKLAAVSNIDGLAAALQGEAGFPTREQMSPVRHRRELPLGFDIVDFPAGR